MSAAWTLISNSLKDYKKEISHILHKHIDNLTFDTDETKEEFSLLCCKLLKESVRKLTETDNETKAVENISSLLDELFYCVATKKIKLSVILAFIEDLFECLSVKALRNIFEIVDHHVGKLDDVEPTDQNSLLRITNSMLKRVSKAQDIEFRGRMHIALSKMLKLCHESGLKNKGISASSVQIDKDDEGRSKVSYRFYQKFWGLQKYFTDPSELNQESTDANIEESQNDVSSKGCLVKLKAIDEIVTEVVRIFNNMPVKAESQSIHQPVKYLTSTHLLDTQLNDSYFRKLFFTQCLFFCFHVKNTATKTPFNLKDDYKSVIADLETKVREALDELSNSLGYKPFGPILDALLLNEANWIDMKENWKERKKNIIRAPDQNTVYQINYYEQYRNDSARMNQYKELRNPSCQKAYQKQEQVVREMREKMKSQGELFRQKFETEIKMPSCPAEPLLPSFEYYFNEAASTLKNLEEKNSISDNFEKKKFYIAYEWKAMKALYKESLHDALIDKKDNSRFKEYRLLGMTKKKQEYLVQDSTKKLKTE